MKRTFREHHLFCIMAQWEENQIPLDLFLKKYFRANHAIGAKDRKEICEAIYGMIRWRGLLDHLCDKPISWEKRFQAFQGFSVEKHLSNEEIPLNVRVSFPQDLFQLLSDSLGEQKAVEFCLASNQVAPTTVRANLLKTTRDALLEKWTPLYPVSACPHSPAGIVFQQKVNFFAMLEFKEGLFEIQDEASQLIADLVTPNPGQSVLDFCAGAGGKSLAIAPKMCHRGQLYLHDIRPFALQEAKKRLKRAGIQNAQVLLPNASYKNALKGKMDWVLVDAPCTGTGTLRRNPDMKWKFQESTLTRLVEEQRKIFEEALPYMKPGGHIVFATCSVLPHENQAQVEYFQKAFQLTLEKEPFLSFPQKGGMDGFFGAVFIKDRP